MLLEPVIASLSLDTFAVSLAIGMAPLCRSTRLAFAGSCVAVEATMPFVGYLIGRTAARIVPAATWLTVAVLLGVGLWMLHESLEEGDEVGTALARLKGGGLAVVAAAFAVGTDELAVGIALGTTHQAIASVAAAVGMQALLMSCAGLTLGRVVGARARQAAGALAGIVLIGTGLWFAVVQITS